MREKGTYTFQSKFSKRNILLFIVLFFILTFQFQEVNSSVGSNGLFLNSEDSSYKINWLEPEVIHGDLPPNIFGYYIDIYPQITCDSRDNLHVVWAQKMHYYDKYGHIRSYNQFRYRYLNVENGSWSNIQFLLNDTYLPQRPKLSIDKNGTIHFAWLRHRDILYKNFRNNSWSDEFLVVENRNESSSIFNFVAGENNKVYFVWDEIRNTTNRDLFSIFYDSNNESWSNISQITNSPYWSHIDSIAINSNHELHMTWYDYNLTTKKPEVFYQVLDEHLNSMAPIEIISTSDYHKSLDSKLVIDSNDNIHVVWIDQELFVFRNISYRSKVSGNWQPIEQLTVGGSAFTPDIYCDINDKIHVVWLEAGSDYKFFFYKSLTMDYRWLNTTRLPYHSGDLWPYIAADGRGNVHVVFSSKSHDFEHGLIHLFGKKAPILEIHGLTIISAIVPGSLFIIVIINIAIIKQKRKRI